MKPETLQLIENILRQELNDNSKIVSILNFFKSLSTEQWIYPATLKRVCDLDISLVAKLFFTLEQQNILQSNYEIYCPQCHKSIAVIELFNQLPFLCECKKCAAKVATLDNAVLVYKMVK